MTWSSLSGCAASRRACSGLLVEVSRRRIFVTMSRVTSIESGAVVLGSGTLNWRRFERRPEETLVLAELLDRKVTVLETGTEVTVVDVAMEQSRTRDWLLTQVAVKEGRRRGRVMTLDWDEVSGFTLPEEGQGAANLLAAFEKLKPADLASMLHDLSDKRRAEVAAALDDERLAAVLEELPEDEQVELHRRARGRARGRRARGDGPRRRRRPAGRSAGRGSRAAAGADGAAGSGTGAAAAVLRRRHRRRHHDQRAGDPAAQLDRRRGARAHPGRARSRRRSPRRSTSCARPTRRPPGAISAWRTSSDCCASRRAPSSAG